LSETCLDFEVKKRFIEKNVLVSSHDSSDKNSSFIHSPDSKTKENGYSGQFEKWIESKDGIIGGYIDAIFPGTEGYILIDYKTGKIFERDDERAGIREDYLFQLRLYAALYHQNYDRWPEKIEIRGFGNLIYEVAVDPKECIKALEDALSLFKTTNALVTESNHGSVGEPDRLANPSPNNCRYCQYRPLCKSYWIAKQQKSEEGWPFDVQGKILEKTPLKNGSTLLKIIPVEPETEPIFIKGVQPKRHPIIGSVGDFVMICSLRPERYSKNFQEGELTTFYLITAG
jgi:hypothetical protein